MIDRLAAMDRIFNPRSIAFVGASNNLGKWGGIIFRNLLDGGYEGKVFPVNPGREEIFGLKAFPSVSAIPEEVDLAIFTIPAAKMPDAISDCVKKRVPAGVVITAGFAELGEEGKRLQEEMVRRAKAGGMVLVGPNGQGISVPRNKLHPWMPIFRPPPGAVGIVSQSGNVCTVLSGELAEFGFGTSLAVSAGNCADLGFPDYLEYLRKDEETKVILLYMEGLDHGKRFLAAAKAAALEKPVIIVKSGRTEAGTRAVASHTGVLAGADELMSAAFNQAGIIRADTLEQAVVMAATFVATPLPRGRRVGIITGGGGFGVLAADAAVRAGLVVPPLSEQTIQKLRPHLPPWWSPNNPVDMVAGLGFGGPRELVPVLMESDEVDGVILLGIGWIYSMLDQIDSKIDFKDPKNEELKKRLENDIQFCGLMADYFFKWGKPFLMTSSSARLVVRRGYPGLLNMIKRGIMLYPTIEDAVLAFQALYRRRVFLEKEGRL